MFKDLDDKIKNSTATKRDFVHFRRLLEKLYINGDISYSTFRRKLRKLKELENVWENRNRQNSV